MFVIQGAGLKVFNLNNFINSFTTVRLDLSCFYSIFILHPNPINFNLTIVRLYFMFLLPFLVLEKPSRTQNLCRDRLRLGYKGGFTLVETAEPKTMNFSKIQGRLEMLFFIDLLENLFYFVLWNKFF